MQRNPFASRLRKRKVARHNYIAFWYLTGADGTCFRSNGSDYNKERRNKYSFEHTGLRTKGSCPKIRNQQQFGEIGSKNGRSIAALVSFCGRQVLGAGQSRQLNRVQTTSALPLGTDRSPPVGRTQRCQEQPSRAIWCKRISKGRRLSVRSERAIGQR